MNIEELVEKIERNNRLYRNGIKSKDVVSDKIYDGWVSLLELIDPDNPILNNIGLEVEDSSRKEKLKIPMASMNKVKTIESLYSWMSSKDIPLDTEFVLTPKLDGCSLTNNEVSGSAHTRGNGIFGQRSDSHLEKIGHESTMDNVHTFGEVIIRKDVFGDKYSDDFSNGRNFVAGLLNSDDAKEALRDCDYIRYGLVSFGDMDFEYKTDILDYLNNSQKVKIPYKTVNISDLSIENLMELYNLWGQDYEIDGIIIEINDLSKIDKIGRERNGNPGFARAIKLDLSERKTSKVLILEYNISKNGDIIPRINIETTNLDGVDISWITCNNARYVKENGIGVGSVVEFIRSGGVIPYITDVIERVGFEIPDIGHELEWDENLVHLRTVNKTDDQILQEIISFFNILEVDSVGPGVVSQLFGSGFNSIRKILGMSQSDLLSLEGFGKRKSKQVYDNIHSKMKNVTLSKLQHASNMFNNLGSKKLLLLEELENPTLEDIKSIDGFSDISANNYLSGIEKYNEFYESIKEYVSVSKTKKNEMVSNDMEGMVFVFSGFRDDKIKSDISSRGGVIKTGISKNVTHLVMKKVGTNTSKEVKAKKLGIDILTVDGLIELIK